MGSMITLGLGKLEVDWGKNSYFRNHSKLFLPSDIKNIPYYYADNIVEEKEGYSRKLKDIALRLELLGYTRKSLKKIYQEHINEVPEYYDPPPVDFDQFLKIIQQIDVTKIELEDDHGDYDLGEYVSQYLFRQKEFRKSITEPEIIDRDAGTIFENLDPYFLLRILANNPANHEIEVQWRYADVLDGGWSTKEEIHEGLSNSEKYLIVTEGSSDLFVIKKSLEMLEPVIADFFYFVDMEEHYPFTGTGNLHRFCQGLSSIKIQNNVIIIYDNDVAGIEKYNESKELSLPPNMKVMLLPNHKEFENFKTIGPNGISLENIDGKAVSIELFLDLQYKKTNEPVVRWKSYNEKMDSYHGELVNKEIYVKNFKTVKLSCADYNFDKLRNLLGYIVATCTN